MKTFKELLQNLVDQGQTDRIQLLINDEVWDIDVFLDHHAEYEDGIKILSQGVSLKLSDIYNSDGIIIASLTKHFI